ncbi:MAG: hypothetical protein FWD59_10415, partial [Micrococcales bacterium]|nr:hypothetical protein [Micrococcales bacterium]
NGTVADDYWQAYPGAESGPWDTEPPLTVSPSCENATTPTVEVPDLGFGGKPPGPPPTSPPTLQPINKPHDTTPALKMVSAPKIAGKAQFGSKLKASPGAWSLPNVTYAYQWLRSGKPITGAKKATYTPVIADVGKTLQVEVTARAGPQSTRASSVRTAKVAKAVPKVTLKLAKKKGAGNSPGKATVAIKIPGHDKPIGTLTIKVGSRKVTIDVKAKKRGKVSVQLPAVSAGKVKVTATFKPAKSTRTVAKAAKSKAATLTIT